MSNSSWANPAGRILAAVALAMSAAVHAAGPAPITTVVVYPGSATVTRAQELAAGADKAVFDCLPATLDAASLQVAGASSIQVGEISVRQRPRAQLGEVCASPLEQRIRALEDQIAVLDAESAAFDYATGYLGSFANERRSAAAGSSEQIDATAQALRASAQEALTRQHEIARKREALALELKPLQAERDRDGGAGQVLTSVQVTLAAPQGGTLSVTYQVPGPSWQPGYRAGLDSKSSQVRVERLAQVRQNTGEDWNGVALTLSTVQPTRATQAPLPAPWRLGIREAMPPVGAPVPGALGRMQSESAKVSAAAAAPAFDVSVFQGAFATEFVVQQRVSVPSSDGAVTLVLETQSQAAQLRVRTTPERDPHAYLIADFKLPAGVWPPGAVSLYRDGSFVGNGHLDADDLARTGLAFGRDDRVSVRVERPEQQRGTAGLIGNRNERTDERRYAVTNRHDDAIALEVLDAAPVSENEEIRIKSVYDPKPQALDWNQQRGTVAWQQKLAAGATQEFSATHTITWPRDAALRELR